VVNRDITLIGPTTGAEGVFHGAWWYYFLALPFALTQGLPVAFYYFITLFALAQGVLLYVFIQRKTHPLLALLCFSILAISPYFIRTSIFAISSIMTLPFVLLLLYSLYMFVQTEKLKYMGLLGLSVGMILEGEVAFGLFIIPAGILAVFLAREAKLFFDSWKKPVIAGVGFGLAVILRIIFELKNDFLQTKALILFKDTPGTHDVGFKTAFFERIDLFKGYYSDIFVNAFDGLGWILFGFALAGAYFGYQKFSSTQKRFFNLTTFLVGGLFFVSLFYNKNYFWTNYLEGIHYMFIILVMFGLHGLYMYRKELALKVVVAYLTLFALTGVAQVYAKAQFRQEPPNEGLRMHTMAINYIHNEVGGNNFCLRIYTPPVMTYTYDYLLDYHARTKGMTYPRTVYQDDQCWYIIESDRYSERRADWLNENIPTGSKKLQEHRISKDLVIQRWQAPSPEGEH
jgi:hypothetical protein